jgi:HSP20 family protein
MTIPKKEKSLKRTREFGTFPSLSTWFDDIVGNELTSGFLGNFNTGMTLPAVNIKENEEAFILEIAVPGMKKSDFNVDVDNKVLTISAEIEESKEHMEEVYTRREFGYSSFKRTFTLPDTVELDSISATYTEGILNVLLPKREDAKQKPPRTIKIS